MKSLYVVKVGRAWVTKYTRPDVNVVDEVVLGAGYINAKSIDSLEIAKEVAEFTSGKIYELGWSVLDS